MASAVPRRFEALDSLRGVCALCVCLLHFKAMGTVHNNAFVSGSWLFVDFFFVLSGFVIAASYRTKLENGFSIPRFVGLRLGRLYPLHFTIVFIMLMIQIAVYFLQTRGIDFALTMQPAFTEDYTLPLLMKQLTFTNILFYSGDIGWNGPSWSISAEFWTYIAAALLFAAARKYATLAAVVVCLLAGATLAVSGDQTLLRIDEMAIFRCFYGFFLGVVTYAAVSRNSLPKLAPGQQSIVQLAGIAGTALFISYAGMGPMTLLAPPIFAAVVLIFSTDEGLFGRALSRAFPRLLGRLSYGIYLVHWLALTIAYQVLGLAGSILHLDLLSRTADGSKIFGTSELSGDVLSVGFLAAVICSAWVLNVAIENPARLWSRRVLANKGSPMRDEANAARSVARL